MKTKTSALVLENNKKLVTAFRDHLGKKVDVVTVTPTVGGVRDEISKQPPDIIVIDLKAVTENEFLEFYSWLHSQPHLAQIPRLFIASAQQKAFVQKLKNRGENHFLSKPIKVRVLLETVMVLIKQGLEKQAKPIFNPVALIGQKIGTAIVEKEIGRGGMGIVYQGYQKSLDRHVAIKVLLPSMVSATGAIERFQREALAIAKLKSPHIVQVYDAGLTENNIFYIVMEFLSGHTLEALLKKNGKIPFPQTIDFMSQLAKGLAVAHDAGLIHRDIKPSNLIINPSGTVTITDFGLVRQVGDLKHTKTGTILGTPYYLSPEQASGKKVDLRSDIYSLGIVFYELLVGKPPYFSVNPLSLILKHLKEPLPDPRHEVPDLPQPLVAILNRMTTKDPEKRYPDCHVLLTELSALVTLTGTMAFTSDFAISSLEFQSKADFLTIDKTFHQQLTHLKEIEPTQFSRNRLRGVVSITKTGSLQSKDGEFPEMWNKVVLISSGLVPQIEASIEQGTWKQAFLKTVEETLTFFPREHSIGAMLFDNEQSSLGPRPLSSIEMKKEMKNPSSLDPASQISSVVGVNGVVVFDTHGNLLDYRLQEHLKAETVTMRLQPIPEIVKSFSIPVEQFDYADFWFEDGRVLLFNEAGKVIVVFSEISLNISLLSLLITRVADQLSMSKSTFRSGAVSAQLYTSESTVKIFKALQTEYARFIGPVAKISIKKEVKKMGYSFQNFPEGKIPNLIDKLTQNLTQSKQEAFREKAMDMLFSFGGDHKS
ncbi:protein kinase [candidate division CSSED10-310 bacterium]|uniref:Protein kinase n=1 Tax=candidate division CSSED10-310 bacterium TaxID=2855610 RepID=A0ABV6YYL2_UNCC1